MESRAEELPETQNVLTDRLLHFIACLTVGRRLIYWWPIDQIAFHEFRCAICREIIADSDQSFPRLAIAAHGATHLNDDFRGEIWDAIRAAIPVNPTFARELYEDRHALRIR